MENGGAHSNKKDTKKKKKSSSIRTIFMHADAADKWLMAFGLLGTLGDGFSLPVMLLVTSKIMNNLGNGVLSSTSDFTNKIGEVTCYSVYVYIYVYVCVRAPVHNGVSFDTECREFALLGMRAMGGLFLR